MVFTDRPKPVSARKVFRIARLALVWVLLCVPPASSPAASVSETIRSVQSGGTVYSQLSPTVDNPIYLPVIRSESLGSVSGKVVRAENGQGLVGAQVCMSGGSCVTTGSSGSYQMANVLSGPREFTALASQCISVTESVEVLPNQSTTLDFGLSNDLSIDGVERRMVLTWDPTPEFITPKGSYANDLDANLWISSTLSVEPVHIYSDQNHRGKCLEFPYSCLRFDETQGFGPETIDVKQLEFVYYYGVYDVYFMYDEENLPPITELDAVVRVYTLEGTQLAYHVPLSGEGNFWYVFAMDHSGQITPTNCIINYPGDSLPSCP